LFEGLSEQFNSGRNTPASAAFNRPEGREFFPDCAVNRKAQERWDYKAHQVK
jgi:hypothetical protein